MIARLIAYSIGSIVAVLAVGTIFDEELVSYADQRAVIIFGVALGALTVFVKPVLKVLTLPISCLTFGLFERRALRPGCHPDAGFGCHSLGRFGGRRLRGDHQRRALFSRR
jgi:hypothetical protein